MKANVLADTNQFLNSISKKKDNTPSELEFVFYILAKEFGIIEHDKYPMPYLNGLISTYNHIKELEIKASKKR